jgi:hypothetical protein
MLGEEKSPAGRSNDLRPASFRRSVNVLFVVAKVLRVHSAALYCQSLTSGT